jgi:hypothetical protein
VNRRVPSAVILAAHADYLRGVPYGELVRQYGVSKSTLLGAFRGLGLRGAARSRGRGGWVRPVPAGGPYGLLVRWMMAHL